MQDKNIYKNVSKDKLEKFLSNISSEKKRLKVQEVDTSHHISNYNDELVSNYDEEKLVSKMINQKQELTTRVEWINFRNECLLHVSTGECSPKFYDKFLETLHTYTPKYYQENEGSLMFLKNFVLWRQKGDIDIIIRSLSTLNQPWPTKVNDESAMYQRRVIIRILDEVLNKHGSSAVVKLRKAFEEICEKSHDYELLYILWTKLFER